MRKLPLILLAMSLLLAACNSTPESTQVADDEVDQEETKTEDLDAEEEEEPEAEDEVAEKEDEGEQATEDTTTDSSEDTGAKTEKNKNKWKKPDKIENMDHLDIVHLAYDIFEAQDRKDYDFLESVAAEGTTIDRNKNEFSFENVTYPFDMNFFTKEELGELELRYTHEAGDGTVTVGFGAINYEEESSIAIDFEFVQEDGQWKMQSMDINA